MRCAVALSSLVVLLATSAAAAGPMQLDVPRLTAPTIGDLEPGTGHLTSLGGLPVITVGAAGVTAQSAQAGKLLGIGLQLGSPSAVTLKFGGPHESGIVLGVGAGFGYGEAFGASLWLQADYVFHIATLLNTDGIDLALYAGPGLFAAIIGNNYGFGFRNDPYVRDFDNFGFGVRLPIGISMAFDNLPLELYLQADPALSVFPGIGFGIGGSLGFRFYL